MRERERERERVIGESENILLFDANNVHKALPLGETCNNVHIQNTNTYKQHSYTEGNYIPIPIAEKTVAKIRFISLLPQCKQPCLTSSTKGD